MLKFFVVAAWISTTVVTAFAQETPLKARKFNHYIGFQTNELIRELVNLNSNASANTNPYIVTYAINLSKSNWGIHAGFGYDYNSIKDNISQINRETRVNRLSFRIGPEKKFSLGSKFEAGVGIDFISNINTDKTFSISIVNTGSELDSGVTTVTSNATFFGGGPQLFLGFRITEKIFFATEASMYFTTGKEKKNILNVNTITNLFTNERSILTSNLNTATDTDDFSINLPIALFLIVKI